MVITPIAATIDQIGGVVTLKGIEGLFENALGALLGLGGILLFGMLIWGGIQFTTSGGDPKSLEQAKKTLTYAIGGIVLVALAYIFLRFIATFTGQTNILNFQIFR